MRSAVTPAQKREAVALAAIVGAEAAAEQLGWNRRSVRKWAEQAGHRPELDGNADAWQRAFDLAHAKVEGFLAIGKASAVAAATIMGIAQRNMRDLERDRRPSPAAESAVAAYDEFTDWLEHLAAERLESEEEIEPTIAAIGAIVRDLLLRRANLEADPYASAPSGHRAAILSWFSGRPEVEAGDILSWAKAQVLEVIEEHGSLVAWHAWQQAEDEAEHARREAEYAVIAARAAALRAEAEQSIHDAEARARLAAAELSRRSKI